MIRSEVEYRLPTYLLHIGTMYPAIQWYRYEMGSHVSRIVYCTPKRLALSTVPERNVGWHDAIGTKDSL